MQPIQIQLFANRKIFSDSVSAFPNSTSNFECFGKKDEAQRLLVSETIDCKKRGY